MFAVAASQTRADRQEQRRAWGQMCASDFSRAECGSWVGTASCPGSPPRARREGVIGGVRGVPPVSIGTEEHRGSLREGLRLRYLPPRSGLHTHERTNKWEEPERHHAN